MLTRRTILSIFMGASIAPALGAAPHPSIAFMERVGKDLLHAHRQGTTSSFLRAIQRHSDLSGISSFALGNYSGKMSSGLRPRYQRGIGVFISRYFAIQSREYPVAKYEIGDAAVGGDGEVVVNSRIYLMSGQSYGVAWKVVWRGGRYQVRDAKVVGFWLTNFLRDEVTTFLAKRNGDFGQLIAALGK